MGRAERDRDVVAAGGNRGYTDAHGRAAVDSVPDGARRQPMFKKTEETEWTRFSKALSSRDQDESEESADAETSARPAVSPGTGRGESVSNAPPARPPVPDTSVASRAGNRSAAASAEEEIESI